MIRTRLSILSVALGLMFIASSANAQLTVATGQKTVTINDKVGKNQFQWVSEAPLENIKGSSEGVAGSFTFDPKNIAGLTGTITTQVKTMKTGNDTRDGHLQNASWLDAAKYPVITFKIKSVKNVKATGADATGVAEGEFSMHGVTKTMAIPFKLKYIPANAKTKERATGDLVMITANFDIALKDYNVTGASGVVGSKVGESIKIEAKLFGNTN